MIYSLASAFIDIILTNGADPDFTIKNKNTEDIKQFLSTNKTKKTAETDNFFRATNLYELFFAALPTILERHMELNKTYIFQNFKRKEEMVAVHFGDANIKHFSSMWNKNANENAVFEMKYIIIS